MNQGYKNTLLSLGRERKVTAEILQKQYPAEVTFLLNGKSYRPIRVSLELLQIIASALRKGGYNG